MDAREIESLSMISRGFEELRDVNPELAYNIVLDVLSGINEYVHSSKLIFGLFVDGVFRAATPRSEATSRPRARSSLTSASSAGAR